MERPTGDRESAALLFGPFRLDPARRSLMRDGEAVALTPTVFDMLLYLVENPGRVVAKDELMEAVWPGRAVTEANLTQTVFTLRKALGDKSGAGRMIVTAPGKGYRFTHPVRREDPPPSPPPSPPPPPPDAVPDLRAPSGATAAASPGRRRSRRRRAIVVLAGAASVAAAGGVLWRDLGWRPSRAQGARNLVVLADFQNLTGESIFDRTLGKALEIDLLQSPFVSVLPERQVQDTLALMARPRDAPMKAAMAEEVCVRNGGQAVLEGVIAKVGASYLLTLTASDCAGGATLAAEKGQAAERGAVIATLDHLAARVRRRLGESGGSVRRFDVPLARQKTVSLEALKAYSEGVYLFNHGGRLESIPLFQHAVELDPAFATAYSDLGRVYSNIHQPALARAAIERAYALRDAVGERERFHIVANYSEIVARDFNATIRNLRLWRETYPRDGVPLANLANAENWLGDYPAAIDAGRRAVALMPASEAAYVVLARALMHADRLEEAAAICGQAVAKGLAGEDTHGLMMEIAFARGDAAGADRELAWSRGKPAEIRLTSLAAEAAYRRGQVRRGDAMFAQVADLARDQGVGDYNPPPTARELYDLGLAGRARALLRRVPADTDTSDYRFDLAEFGDAARARALLDRDLQAAPADTLLRAVSASEVRAALALRRGRPREAVEALAPALRYEAKNYDIPYLRGLAWLAAADGPHAAAEFRKITDHPGLAPTSPLYPLAILGTARALRLAGDAAGSRAAFERVLATWKDGDADLPARIAAVREFSALTASAPRHGP